MNDRWTNDITIEEIIRDAFQHGIVGSEEIVKWAAEMGHDVRLRSVSAKQSLMRRQGRLPGARSPRLKEKIVVTEEEFGIKLQKESTPHFEPRFETKMGKDYAEIAKRRAGFSLE